MGGGPGGFYAVIMAGGSGTRLWPLSRRSRPKQAQQLVGDRTLFQHAVDRLAPLFPSGQIRVVTKSAHVPLLQSQTPELSAENFIVEPEGRGTAPALGLAAIHLQQRDPDAVMAVLTADHFIADTGAFRAVLVDARVAAAAGYLVTLGIAPAFPSTGYGYIRKGETLRLEAERLVFRIERFVEKPDSAKAAEMVADGGYFWNSGMFIWRVSRLLEELRRQMPEFYAQLLEVAAALGHPAEYAATLARVWPQVREQTIDYGVMEGARDAAVIPARMGWTDVGDWASLLELLPADAAGNVSVGPRAGIDTRNTLAMGRTRLIATIGVEDLVIVDTEDALLVCRKDRTQDVKRIVRQLEKDGRDEWL
jgi:mannose-1-phosphate guanylyltransferase